MAIAQVHIWQPRPGRIADFMAIVKKADKILRGLGATTRTLTRLFGGVPGSVVYVVETAEWNAFGDFNAKLQADKNWQALSAELNSTDRPVGDLISSAMYSEIPLG